MRWRRKSVVCEQAVAMVTDYLEDAMSTGDRRRLESHLDGCPHCHEYFAQMRTTIASVGHVEPESLSPQARDDLIALYRNWRADTTE
jgi:anti-sigma factor RsiW